jgi:hypothetical protein
VQEAGVVCKDTNFLKNIAKKEEKKVIEERKSEKMLYLCIQIA